MTRLILTVGLPASGKSTWANTQIHDTDVVIVSKDEIRERLGLPFGTAEVEVMAASLAQVAYHLEHGQTVIYDGVNLSAKTRRRVIEIAEKLSIPHFYKMFVDTPLDVCIARNSTRTGTAKIPEHAIRKLHADCILSGTWQRNIEQERILP